MSYVTKEQIALVKEIDLLTYLQKSAPQELKVTSPNEYCTVSHDSLKISNGKWHWFSQNIGGKTALDYLIKVRGMEFTQAVNTLMDDGQKYCSCNQSSEKVQVKSDRKKFEQFKLPTKHTDNKQVIAYLKKREIDCDITTRCIRSGIIYEDKSFHNSVFVGKDSNGKARFACLRSTKKNLKQDVIGSDKRYSFCLSSSSPSSRFLAVAESPIDALSIATIRKKLDKAWDRYHYLSLGGISSKALFQYLKDHPEIDNVFLFLDNDKAGLEAMERIKTEIGADKFLKDRIGKIETVPPKYGKDYNEYLQRTICDKIKYFGEKGVVNHKEHSERIQNKSQYR